MNVFVLCHSDGVLSDPVVSTDYLTLHEQMVQCYNETISSGCQTSDEKEQIINFILHTPADNVLNCITGFYLL